MALTKIWDLAYEVNGAQIQLEQDAGCGEVHRIELHPIHIRLLATECGLMHGDLNAWQRVATLERRLCILRDRIEDLDKLLWSVPVFGGNGTPTEDCVHSDLLLTLADEFVADLGLDADAMRTHSEGIGANDPAQAKPAAKHGGAEKKRGEVQPGLPLEEGR